MSNEKQHCQAHAILSPSSEEGKVQEIREGDTAQYVFVWKEQGTLYWKNPQD